VVRFREAARCFQASAIRLATALLLALGKPDGFIVHSFTGNGREDDLALKDWVRDRLGMKKGEMPDFGTRVPRQDQTDAERAEFALKLWREARDMAETAAERYLARRGLSGAGLSHALRFHSACPFPERGRRPAMVALVRHIQTDKPLAIHRTALLLDGSKDARVCKDGRASLGPIKGGAVKLTKDEEVTTCIGIGEGIETMLSLRLMEEFGPSPVWCVLNAEGVKHFPVLPGIEVLWIAVDHDETGIAAAETCKERWLAAGCEMCRLTPPQAGQDLNDMVKGAANAER
jgi:hypothetical protein